MLTHIKSIIVAKLLIQFPPFAHDEAQNPQEKFNGVLQVKLYNPLITTYYYYECFT